METIAAIEITTITTEIVTIATGIATTATEIMDKIVAIDLVTTVAADQVIIRQTKAMEPVDGHSVMSSKSPR